MLKSQIISTAHEILIKKDHSLAQKKKIPYKFKRIHAIQSMSLDHNRTKLGIDSRNTYRNSPRHMHESKRK